MTTFAPGPSYISPAVVRDIERAAHEHILELSHRSKEFSDISRTTIQELRTFLHIPPEYRVFYFPSASDIWHSLVANTVRTHSAHFVNGAFSEKAAKAAKLLYKEARVLEHAWGDAYNVETPLAQETELITACMNETSTGIKMTERDIRTLRTLNPDALLAVDVTSCAGAVPLPIAQADAWYFSVQKGFGLPAGLALLILSPRAYARSVELEQTRDNLAGFWRWSELEKTMVEKDHQTPHTPNVFDIFLLGEELKRRNISGGIAPIYEQTLAKKALVDTWLASHTTVRRFGSADGEHISDTVCTIAGEPEHLQALIEKARAGGHSIGNGYGKLKGKTVRIATFPQHSIADVESLLSVL